MAIKIPKKNFDKYIFRCGVVLQEEVAREEGPPLLTRQRAGEARRGEAELVIYNHSRQKVTSSINCVVLSCNAFLVVWVANNWMTLQKNVRCF